MRVKIWVREGWMNINPEKAPRESRQLDSFLFYNNAPKCFLKGQGGWYKITKRNTLIFVSRTLYLLSFNEWLEIALNDNYVSPK